MAYIGTCADMCPERERRTRVGHSISIFERDHNNEPDQNAMVKEYRRSGADQEEPPPEDLRTIQALQRTLDHLVCNTMNDSRSITQELALDWYDFLWDRLRAIRKDITQQNICDPNSAILVERCARFHVHSCYAMNRVKDFDVDMNKRNLNDCLQMLRQMYHDLRTTDGTVCAGELEFQKYDILLHLNQDHLSSTILMKCSEYRSSDEMRFITKVFSAYTNNDYYRLFQLMRQADYMTSCLLSLYANKMRITGLRAIINACARGQSLLYPSELAIQILGFDDDEDLTQFAEAVGIETQMKDDKMHLVLSRNVLSTLRSSESQLPAFKSRCLVEDKMDHRSVGQLVHGGSELPPNPNVSIHEEKVSLKSDSPILDVEMSERPPPTSWFNDSWTPPETDLRNGSIENVEMPIAEPQTTQLDIDEIEQTEAKTCDVKVHNDVKEVKFEPSNVRFDAPISSDFTPKINWFSQIHNPILSDFGAATESTPQIPKTREDIVAKPSSTPEVESEVDEQIEDQIGGQYEDQTEDATEDQVEDEIDDEISEEITQSPALIPCPESFSRNSELEIARVREENRATVADAMPAGFFKVRSLSSSQPTLRLPPRLPLSEEVTPNRRFKPVNSLQKKLDSISHTLEDEKRANKAFARLTDLFTQ